MFMMHQSVHAALLSQSLLPLLHSSCNRLSECLLKAILLIIKFALMALVFLLDVPKDVSTCMFIILFFVADKPYNGTFKTSTWYDIFRMVIHLFLIIFFWPLFDSLDISFMYSICTYLVLSFLELVPKGCVFPSMDKRQHRETIVAHHDIISPIAGYLIATYVFGFHINNVIICILFIFYNYLIHASLIPTVCNSVIKTILNAYWFVKSNFVLRKKFLKKFGKLRTSCYIFIMIMKVICFTVAIVFSIYLFYQGLSYFHGPNGGLETVDMSKTVTFSNNLDTKHRKAYSMHVPSIDRVETYIQNVSFTMKKTEYVFRNHIRSCKTKKAILYDNVLLSVKTKRSYSGRNALYLWSVNGKPVTEISYPYKYVSFMNESDTKRRYTLIIRNVNTNDFGTYTLKKQSCYNTSYCSNYIIQSNKKNTANYITVRTKIIACRFLKQSSQTIKIYGTVGEMVKLTNIKLILETNRIQSVSVHEFNFEFMKILLQCPCNPFVTLSTNMAYTKTIRSITDSWSEVILNISFCICGDTYTFDSELVYFSRWDGFVIPTNFHLSVEPRPTDLFKQELATEFIICEKLGYTLETFYACLRRHSFDEWNTDKNPMSLKFAKDSSKEFFLIITFIILITYTFISANECLDKILFNIFHNEIGYQYRGPSLAMLFAEFEFDVYLSYNDESIDDKQFAEETIKPFLKETLGYHICDYENIMPGQNRRRGFEENVMKSKALIILLSSEYLSYDICMQLEYEYTLLSLLGTSKISRDNILIIKMDTCPQDARPLTQFTVIDWSDSVTNIRTESEKKEELQEWLIERLRKPGKLKKFILELIVIPILRRIYDTEL